MTIIYFIVLLSVIITIHEFGHFITAKMFGVYCNEFSLGMGPQLFKKKIGETTYSLRALPIGGFVSMAGEADAQIEIEVPYERTIKGIAKWKQIIVFLAGIFMNFILAWVIFSGVILASGSYALAPQPIIDGIIENSAASEANLQKGDRIVAVKFSDGTEIHPDDFYDILTYTSIYHDEALYTIERGNEQLTFLLTPRYSEETDSYLIGVMIPPSQVISINLLNAGYYGFDYLADTAKEMFETVLRLFRGIGLNQLSGPVGIYNATAQQVSYGLRNYLLLIGLMSLNIGIFNAIPLPALDGGRVFLLLIEMVIGKPLNKKFENAIILASFALFFALMIFVTFQDVIRLFS